MSSDFFFFRLPGDILIPHVNIKASNTSFDKKVPPGLQYTTREPSRQNTYLEPLYLH